MHEEYIRKVNNSDTVVLFVHGIIGTPDQFRDLIPVVPKEWSVYNILLDGHGGSVKDFAASSMEKWKKQVRELLNKLRDDYDKIYLVGHSMGALLLIQEAVRNPLKIKGLFLMAVPFRAGVKMKSPETIIKVIFGENKSEDAWIEATKHACSIKLERRLWMYLSWIPRYIELLAEMKGTRSLTKELCVPCVVLQSGKDELVARSSVKYFNGNSLVKKHILENSGHFYYPEEDVGKLKRIFRRFVLI